jgi:hypothetical protein
VRPRLLPAVLLAGLLAACGNPAPASDPGTAPTPAPSLPADGGQARIDLAARAALAQDHRFAALYTWDVDGQAPRSVVATVAADGSWRVDIPGGALGGTADVSIVQTAEGVFQCALPSATNPANPACVRVAEVNKRLPDRYDPKVQRLFRQWLPVFTDRQAALSVVPALPLPGAQGQCYSVDGISAHHRGWTCPARSSTASRWACRARRHRRWWSPLHPTIRWDEWRSPGVARRVTPDMWQALLLRCRDEASSRAGTSSRS